MALVAVADELELSLLNSGLFLLSPSGRWCVYNSMMDGVRSSTMMEIAFQCKPGSSELSCWSVLQPDAAAAAATAATAAVAVAVTTTACAVATACLVNI